MMKVVFVATAAAVALISISLTWAPATLAAPTQSKANSDLKNQLLKSIINQAIVQQEDSHSNKDKEMAATFCKLTVQLVKFLGDESLNFGDASRHDYCQDIELSPEPRPGQSLADVYQVFFNILKDSDIKNMLKEHNNFLLNRIG